MPSDAQVERFLQYEVMGLDADDDEFHPLSMPIDWYLLLSTLQAMHVPIKLVATPLGWVCRVDTTEVMMQTVLIGTCYAAYKALGGPPHAE